MCELCALRFAHTQHIHRNLTLTTPHTPANSSETTIIHQTPTTTHRTMFADADLFVARSLSLFVCLCFSVFIFVCVSISLSLTCSRSPVMYVYVFFCGCACVFAMYVRAWSFARTCISRVRAACCECVYALCDCTVLHPPTNHHTHTNTPTHSCS